MFNKVVEFMQGLTKEEVYGNTVKVTNVEVVDIVDEYKEGLYKSIEERMEEIDKEFNYRLNRIRLAMEDEVQLTPFVKGGRL